MNNLITAYTYLIKHIPSNKFYYGVRYAKGCDPKDLWVNYFTSSKHIKRLIELDGKNSFEIQIRKTFSDANKARIWENKVLNRLNVINRSDFINKSNNISISPEAAASAMKGKHQSEKQKLIVNQIGKANLGRKHTEETRKKVSISLIGNTRKLGVKESIETKLKKSLAKIGKPGNAIGNYQPRCSCIICKKETTSGTLKRHFNYYH